MAARGTVVRATRILLAGTILILACCGKGGGSRSGSGSTGSGGGLPGTAWQSADIGAVGAAGSTAISGATHTLSGSGADIWDSADAFRFVYQALSGDGEIVARVLSLDPTDEWAKSGVMIRESLDPGSRFAMTVVTPSHGTSLQTRPVAGAGCALDFGPNGQAPYWVRLTRSGDQFTGAASPDGVAWTSIATRTIPMGADVFVGLCVTAHNNTKSATTVIDAVSLQGQSGGGPFVLGGLQPVLYRRVALDDNFFAPRIEKNRTTSIPMMRQAFIDNHTIDNFPKTAGFMGGNHDGFPWADGDVYALIEAMSYAIALHPDAGMEAQMESLITNVIAAQIQTGPMAGYLNTYFQLGNAGRNNDGGTLTLQPWEDLIGAHEHVVLGGLLQSGISHYQSTGRTNLLEAARKCADHMSSVFGEGKRSGVPGHQGPEYVLLKLWSLPGKGKASDYEQAKFYIDERGRHSGGRQIYGEFCQDLKPIRQESEPVGHCVRGPYMWAAATDLAATSNDAALQDAMKRIWNNVVERKMYPTGGIGHHLYNEGFGPDYDLSNDLSYNETCAAVAMIFWAHRMVNAFNDGRYADVMERILYNGFSSGRSLAGDRLYYNNYMVRTGNRNRFGIPCCAVNNIRMMPQVGGYQYGTQGDGLWAHLYIAGQASIPLGGRTIGLKQETAYPWDGAVTLRVALPSATAFTLHLRIPEWAAGASATVNGASVPMGAATKGYLPIARTWQNGDVVQLQLPMPVRRVHAHPKAFAQQGRAAIARGPIVYCLESNDNAVNVHRIVIPSGATLTPEYDGGLLGGVTKLRGSGQDADNGSSTSVTLIPYGAWDNRTHDSSMAVMIPETSGAAVVQPDRGRVGNATVERSFGNDVAAPNDGILPTGSNDQTIPRFTWWNHQGTEEWISYTFPSPMSVGRSDIYWFSDADAGGGCDFPQSFRTEYWNGGGWSPVQLDADYDHAPDLFSPSHFTIVRFAPVTTTKVRIVAQLKPGKSAGILEWRLPE